MSKLEYNIAIKKLTLLDNKGATLGIWNAVSGPHHKGHLPRGNFTVGNPNGNKLRDDLKKGFQMSSGLGYFIPIYGTPGRTSIGIHPDGGVPGTSGCIGITQDAHGFFKQYIKFRPTRIHVK